MKLRVTFKSAEFIGRGKIEAMLEDWMEGHVKPLEKFRGFAEKELSATISKQDDDEKSFSIKLHMHVPPNTILVARGEANHFQPATEKALETLLRHYVNHIDRMRYQDANKRQSRRSRLESLRDQRDALSNELLTEAGTNIESLLPKLEGTIRRELTFLRSQGDLPYSYPTTHDILDEVIASAISDWKPGIDSQAAYIQLLQEMHEILNREVGASHVYGDIVSLETLAPKDAIDQAESMVGEEFYEFYQPDELLRIEDLITDKKALMLLENGQDDQKINYLLRLIKELPINWRRALMLHEIENVSVNELARLMDADPEHVQDWINFSNHFLDARLLDAGFEAGIGRILSDLRGDDQ